MNNKIPCSVTILTLNNEDTIRQCLASVSFCDDIVVLDGNSTDKTVEIAKEFGARVYPQVEGPHANAAIQNFTQMRVKSFNLAKHDWVFYIDSDEYLDETLQEEISQVVEKNDKNIVGKFKRIAIVEGKKIDRAYFYPEFTDRLINRKAGIHWKPGSRVHESLVYPEGIEKQELKGKLFSYWPDLASCKKKDTHYLKLAREKFIDNAHKTKWSDFLRGLWKNTLRALKVFALALWLPVKYRSENVLPFRYHMRFFWYNLVHAWHPAKFKALIIASWKRLPKMLRTIMMAAIIIRIVLFAALLFTQGQSSFVYGPNGDAVEFVTIAENLKNHGEFSLSKEAPFLANDFRTPGMPVFLMLTGGAHGVYWPGVIIQIIASLALILMIYFFTKRYFNENIAFIAAGLAALEPNMWYWPTQLIGESLFTVFLFGAIYCFVDYLESKRLSVLIGYAILLAIATYLRQISYPLIFLLPLIGLLSIKKQRFTKMAIAVMMPLILLSPWFYRNHVTLGDFTYGSSFAVRGSVGKYVEAYTQKKFQKPPVEVYEELQNVSGGEAANAMMGVAIKSLAKDPLAYIGIGATTLIPFFASDGWFTIAKSIEPHFEIGAFDKTWLGEPGAFKAFISNYIQSGGVVFLIAKALYALLTLAMIFGLLMALREKHTRKLILLLAVIVIYFAAASGLGSYARFRYPIQPILFIFAAIFLARYSTLNAKR